MGKLFNFRLGNIEISGNNINEIKEFVNEISEKLGKNEEYSGYISDFVYAVDSEYQTFHGLGPDNWDTVHED
jgi:hypothetical protein